MSKLIELTESQLINENIVPQWIANIKKKFAAKAATLSREDVEKELNAIPQYKNLDNARKATYLKTVMAGLQATTGGKGTGEIQQIRNREGIKMPQNASRTLFVNIDNYLFEANILKLNGKKIAVELLQRISSKNENISERISESKNSRENKFSIYVKGNNKFVKVSESKVWTKK